MGNLYGVNYTPPPTNPGFPASFVALVSATAYINSVQMGTISIAIGSLTGTATVSAPSGVGVLWPIGPGFKTTATTIMSEGFAYLTISGTTITATRTLQTAGAITIQYVYVDMTALFAKTQQTGTIAISSGVSSNTASCSAITDNNGAPGILGYATNTATMSYNNNDGLVTQASTTVTYTKQFAGSTLTGAWVLLELQGAVLNQAVQRVAGSTAGPSASTWTVSVTSVNRNNAFSFWAGDYGNSSNNPATSKANVQLTSATQYTATTGATSFIAQKFAIGLFELIPGILNSNMQRGTIALTAATSNNASVSAVSITKSIPILLGDSTTNTSGSMDKDLGYLSQTNATTLNFQITTAATVTASYELFEGQ